MYNALSYCTVALIQAWKSRRRVDVIHLHAGHFEYAILAVLIRPLFRGKIVQSIYCPPARAGRRRWLQRFVATTVPRSTSFIGMSDEVSRGLAQILPGRMAPRIGTVGPPLDVEYWAPHSYAGSTSPTILFVGNATATKGLDLVVLACADLARSGADFKLVITTELDRTSGVDRIRLLKEMIRSHGLERQASLHGVVPSMRELVQSCDVHVAPFRTTQGPSDIFLTSVEAMACGKAVICSRLPGMETVVRDGVDGLLVTPGSRSSLSDTLARLVSDSELRERLGRSARSRAVELFDSCDIERKVRDIYETN